MLRNLFKFLIGAVAAGLAAASAQAGSPCCGGCGDPCAQGLVEVVGPPEVTPFYLVDQGPVFYGPGITRGPSYFEATTSSYRFPYIGYSYYPPYDGGPYADPIRHHVLHGGWETPNWHRSAATYRPSAGPRIIRVSHDYIGPAGRRVMRQPLRRDR